MEFASFHLQHQLQEESAQCIITPTTPPPPDSKPFTTTSQSWIPTNIYNGCNSGFLTESCTNSRESQHQHAMTDSLRISTRQAFDFHNGKISFSQHHPASYLFPSRAKGEMINNSMKAMEESCSIISNHEPQYSSASFLSSLGVTGEEFSPTATNNVYHNDNLIDGGITLSKRYNFGDFASISNLPTLDLTPSLVSCSLGLKPKMLDLHKSYGGNCGIQLPCYDSFGLNEKMSLSHGDMHGLQNSPTNISNKISSFPREVAMTKRPNNGSLSKEYEAKTKKSRPSCPPLKADVD